MILIVYLSMGRDTRKSDSTGIRGLTFFNEKGDCIKTNSKSRSSELDVLQVLDSNLAIATIKSYSDKKLYEGEIYRDYDIANDLVVLLVSEKGNAFYDNQKIQITQKCMRQVGIYQYTTKFGNHKTVPAVVME